jgi:hypothetical protein
MSLTHPSPGIPGLSAQSNLATPHKLDDLNPVLIGDCGRFPVFALRDMAVDLDCNPVRPDPEMQNQVADISHTGASLGFPVDYQREGSAHNGYDTGWFQAKSSAIPLKRPARKTLTPRESVH